LPVAGAWIRQPQSCPWDKRVPQPLERAPLESAAAPFPSRRLIRDTDQMGWLLLALAIAAEIVGTISLKYTNGFRTLIPSTIVLVSYAGSFYCLSLALKHRVPLSSAYAIWSAVGTAVIAIVGVVFFAERMNPAKVVGLVAIIGGVIALNLSGGGSH
jgi:small multidrug resistance pump